ncbi:MAG: S1 family peptidase [Cryobacterium sp.]|nr:S1 family peptidase [Cryobacterium sp.]
MTHLGGAIGALLLLATLPISTSAADVSPEEFEYAQTFRRSVGLPAGDALVVDSFGDARYTSEEYGVPLSAQEVQSLSERSRIRQAMQPAIREASTWGGFGGVYIDQERDGTAVLQFVSDLDDRRDRLRELMPEDARYEVVRVEYTYDELLRIKSDVARSTERLLDDDIEVVEVGPDERRNRVTVGVAGGVSRAREALEKEFGPAVRVEASTVGQMDCSRNDCRPVKGGIQVLGDDGPLDYCTSAFLAKTSGGTKRLVTAGHCMVARKGHIWKHDGSPLGTALDHTLDSSESTCGASGNDYCADAGWFDLDGSETPLPDPHQLLRTTLVYSFDGVRHDGAQLQGDLIYRAGRTTDLRSGLITARNQRRKTIGNGNTYWIDDMFVMDRDARGGDSGGPYWVEYDFSGWRFRMVAGIHSHSTPDTNDPDNPCEEDDNDPDVPNCRAWYTTADTFEDESPLTICTLATCP